METMQNLEYIPINIWDDFYDDGYVPEGEKLETYIYVEDSEISHEKRKECLKILLDFINKNLNIKGVKLWMEFYESRKKYPNLIGTEHEHMLFDRWEIKIEGLTHKKLDDWMTILESSEIKVDDIPFLIYSES
jgi:hypothetical protein